MWSLLSDRIIQAFYTTHNKFSQAKQVCVAIFNEYVNMSINNIIFCSPYHSNLMEPHAKPHLGRKKCHALHISTFWSHLWSALLFVRRRNMKIEFSFSPGQ
jgi:hypothetical protein